MVLPRVSVCLGLLLAPVVVSASEIRSALDEARAAYDAGDLAAARMAVGEAAQLLLQRASDDLARAMPDPLEGWDAEEAEAQTAGGLALFGGAGIIQASRTYRHTAQGRDVSIEISADNPLMAQMTMMFGNPQLAGAMGRFVRVGSERAIQTREGELMMVLNNRFLVRISGDGTAEEKLAYARAIEPGRLPR